MDVCPVAAHSDTVSCLAKRSLKRVGALSTARFEQRTLSDAEKAIDRPRRQVFGGYLLGTSASILHCAAAKPVGFDEQNRLVAMAQHGDQTALKFAASAQRSVLRLSITKTIDAEGTRESMTTRILAERKTAALLTLQCRRIVPTQSITSIV